MRTIETQLFTYDELDEAAKEKAREWYRENGLDYPWYECTYEDATQCAALLGIDITRIYFSGFYSQGDGACFEGSYTARENSLAAILEHAPLDDTLHAIAAALDKLQSEWRGGISATVKHSGHYYHAGCTIIECELDAAKWQDDEAATPDLGLDNEKTVETCLRAFMQWIYKQLETQYDYLMSDEAIAETLLANEYEFLASGKFHN